MAQPVELYKGLWTFPITLPNNPLKALNCYVVKAEQGSRNLLVDTGFRRGECYEELCAGMRALAIDPESTDVFITHFHSDHAGNARALQDMGCHIIMSRVDYEVENYFASTGRADTSQRALREGMSPETLAELIGVNPGINYCSPHFGAELKDDGDKLVFDGFTLKCISMPGHTPGQMCLYEPDKKIMILGDHVLFDITPNIGAWPQLNNSLGTYIDSLLRMREYEVILALPGHRSAGSITMRERIDQIIEHHMRRLAEMEAIIKSRPGIAAYDLTPLMHWKIHAANWETFPPAQKWYAFSETLAHLDYLTAGGRIFRRISGDGTVAYYAE